MYHGPDRIVDGSERERYGLLRSFYRSLEPGPELRAALEGWEMNLDAPFTVGVNIRTGNGQYFGKGGTYRGRVNIEIFRDEERFLRAVERACISRTRSLPRYLRGSPSIFFATDSEPMSRLLARIPNAVTRRTVFPPSGAGDLYAFPAEGRADRLAVLDTLADMFLLARCDALVYNTSLFNQYARIATGCFGGNMVHLESRFLRRRLALYRAGIEGIIRRRVLSRS
jgi:hypothetical protein